MTGPSLHYEDPTVRVTGVVVGRLGNNVYVVRCRETGDSVLVDAAGEPDRLLALARTLGVRRVVQTHGHRDHVQAVPAMRAAGYEVAVHPADAHMLPAYDAVLEDAEVAEVGRLRLHVVHTPGHTPGSVCFRLEGAPVLLAGDTLFPGGPGATRWHYSDFDLILRSIDERLFATLAPETLVLPGHGPSTTIGDERPHLQDWVKRGW